MELKTVEFRLYDEKRQQIIRKTQAMYKFYSPENEEKYGVLGIKISKLLWR